MWALRWLLLLGPLAMLVVLVEWRKPAYRQQVAAFFAFLYGASMIFVTHSVAIWMGWWHYGWDSLMLNGIPADILIGGAVLFGPVLYFAFPLASPVTMCVIVMAGLHGTMFTALKPLVGAGSNWPLGVAFVFATAHAPAIYLARWTERQLNLHFRAALLAIMYAGLALGILPTLVMAAMGGFWALADHSLLDWLGLTGGLLVSFVIGLAGVQMLAVQGLGTAIPLDPTQRLVRTGIYAYVRNPMQLSAALSWVVLGLFLGNVWVIAAAVMAWVFVEGVVRWHHRQDLLQRFPEGWPEYRRDVPEWRPLWRPSFRVAARLSLNPNHFPDCLAAGLLRTIGVVDLDIRYGEGPARYENPVDIQPYRGLSALCMALTHGNFATALLGHAWLLPALPLQSLAGSENRT